NPPQGSLSYVFDSVVGHEDLYTFPSLSPVSTVHAVAMKANCARSDSGARTVSMRMLSGGTDGGGSATGQTPGTSFGWLTSLFITDPATGAAWSPTAVNAATAGFKIDASMATSANLGGVVRETLSSSPTATLSVGGVVREALLSGTGLYGTAGARSAGRASASVLTAGIS